MIPRISSFLVLLLACVSVGLPLAHAASAEGSTPGHAATAFELGRDYQRLDPPSPLQAAQDGRVEIVEIFWYGCSHCAEFEPMLKNWLAEHKDEVRFVRVPAAFPMARMQAQAYYTAEVLGKVPQMHAAFFKEIHELKKPLSNEDQIQEFFARNGVDASHFKAAFHSAAVEAKLKSAAEISFRYRMTFVPWIVVDGRYTSDPTQAGGAPALIRLMSELTSQRHQQTQQH